MLPIVDYDDGIEKWFGLNAGSKQILPMKVRSIFNLRCCVQGLFYCKGEHNRIHVRRHRGDVQ